MISGLETRRRLAIELDDRMERVMALMRAQELDGLVVYSDAGNAANVRYLTNYRPLFGVAIVVTTNSGAIALVNTFNWDAPRALLEREYDLVLSGFATGDFVHQVLRQLGIRSRRLGLVGADIIPHRLYQAIFEKGDDHGPVDVSGDYQRLRLIKSPFELESLRSAASITDDAIRAMIPHAGPGVSERTLAAFLEHEMKRLGADGLAFPAAVASGPNTEKPVSLPTDRCLETGDLLMVDVGATFDGYAADVTRTFVVGPSSDRQSKVSEAVSAALEAATNVVAPGIPANRLHETAVATLEKHHLHSYFTHRVGHGIGLETSLEAPDLQWDDTLLEPDMTFCIEPGVYIPGFGGIKIEDDIIVTADGAEVISSLARELVSV
jgi:Xaa-Pro aminopeptidase